MYRIALNGKTFWSKFVLPGLEQKLHMSYQTSSRLFLFNPTSSNFCQTTRGEKFLLTATSPCAVIFAPSFNPKAYHTALTVLCNCDCLGDWAQHPLAWICARGQRWQMSLWQVKQELVSICVTETEVAMAIKYVHVSSGSLNMTCSSFIMILLWLCQLEKVQSSKASKTKTHHVERYGMMLKLKKLCWLQIFSTTFKHAAWISSRAGA